MFYPTGKLLVKQSPIGRSAESIAQGFRLSPEMQLLANLGFISVLGSSEAAR